MSVNFDKTVKNSHLIIISDQVFKLKTLTSLLVILQTVLVSLLDNIQWILIEANFCLPTVVIYRSSFNTTEMKLVKADDLPSGFRLKVSGDNRAFI